MQKTAAKWIEFLYGPFFRVIGFFYRSYKSNRARVEALKANRRVASVLRMVAFVILFAWILTWFLASDESRNRLVEEVKESIGGFGSGSDQ